MDFSALFGGMPQASHSQHTQIQPSLSEDQIQEMVDKANSGEMDPMDLFGALLGGAPMSSHQTGHSAAQNNDLANFGGFFNMFGNVLNAAISQSAVAAPMAQPESGLSKRVTTRLTSFPDDFSIDEANLVERLCQVDAALAHLKGEGDSPEMLHTSAVVIMAAVTSSFTPSSAHREEVMKLLVDKGVIPFLKKLWEHINQVFISNPASWEAFAEHDCYSPVKVFLNVFMVIWNGSNILSQHGQPLLRKLAEETLEFILNQLNSSALRDSKAEVESTTYMVIYAFLDTLQNFAQYLDDGADQLCGLSADEVIALYLEFPDSLIKCLSRAVLTFCLKGRKGEEMITVSTETLKSVLHTAGKSLREDIQLDGFNSIKVLEIINRLAISDTNKKRLVECEALSFYTAAMVDNVTNQMKVTAAQGIAEIAVLKECKKKIKDTPGCVEALKKLSLSTDLHIKEAASDALWLLDNKEPRKKISGQKKGHIMISYSWAEQKEVLKFRDRLRTLGFDYWIDVEKMSSTGESTLDAMAKAVEGAAVVLIFFSEKYRMSDNCRAEAEYAHKKKKMILPVLMQHKYQADGWLGFLLGGKFYYDLTKPELYEETIKKLLADIIAHNENSDNAHTSSPPDHANQKSGACCLV